MNSGGWSFGAVLVIGGLLVACSPEVPSTDQSGPLRVGNESGISEHIYCAPASPDEENIGFGDIVANEGTEPVEILSVELSGATNLQAEAAGVWEVGRNGALYYWSDSLTSSDKRAAAVAASIVPAAGFIVDPGTDVGIAVPVTRIDAGQPAETDHLLVRYRSGGTSHAELTSIGYRVETAACG